MILRNVLIATIMTVLSISGTASGAVTFSEVAQQAGVRQVTPTWGASFLDVNGDGFEDIYSTNHQYFEYLNHVEIPPAMFINNGDGTFMESASALGLISMGDLHGMAWGDYNNDGLQDLFQSTGGAGVGLGGLGAPNYFYKNLGSGTFQDIATGAGLVFEGSRGRGGFWLDYNLDGLLDLFVLNARKVGTGPSVLMQNNGDDTFTMTGVTVDGGYTGSPVDFDSDGLLDLFVLKDRDVVLLKNNGDGTFSDVTATSGLVSHNNVKTFAWGDYDNDGDMDCFLSMSFVKDSFAWDASSILFETQVQGGTEKGLDFTTSGSAVTFGLYDYLWTVDPLQIFIGSQGIHPSSVPFTLAGGSPEAQGRPGNTNGLDTAYSIWEEAGSLFVRATVPPDFLFDHFNGIISNDGSFLSVTPYQLDLRKPVYVTLLYENLGNGTFVDVTASSRVVNFLYGGMASVWADFDNDGWLDLYVVNTGELENAPNRLYMNNGDKTFTQAASVSGVEGNVGGRGENAVVGDYDNNGFMDIFVTNGYGPAPFSFGEHLFYKNNGNSNHWLKVKLMGKITNRDAIGASVTARTGSMTQFRPQTGGATKYSQNSPVLHFGLGASVGVDTLTIKWPSGIVQNLGATPSDQTLVITEPTVAITLVPVETTVTPGGNLVFDMTLRNETNLAMTFDFWTNMTLPDGSKYPLTSELRGPKSVTLQPYATVTKRMRESIPLRTKPGSYTYNGFVGPYDKAWNQNSFSYVVK